MVGLAEAEPGTLPQAGTLPKPAPLPKPTPACRDVRLMPFVPSPASPCEAEKPNGPSEPRAGVRGHPRSSPPPPTAGVRFTSGNLDQQQLVGVPAVGARTRRRRLAPLRPIQPSSARGCSASGPARLGAPLRRSRRHGRKARFTGTSTGFSSVHYGQLVQAARVVPYMKSAGPGDCAARVTEQAELDEERRAAGGAGGLRRAHVHRRPAGPDLVFAPAVAVGAAGAAGHRGGRRALLRPGTASPYTPNSATTSASRPTATPPAGSRTPSRPRGPRA